MQRSEVRIAAGAGAFAVLGLAALPALAHPGHAGHETLNYLGGILHPLTGLDHVLAMVAVGLWATLRGRGALVAWPATFVAAMLVGFAWGEAVGAIPGVESAILATVIVLGVLTAADARMPAPAALAIVAAAGLLHGQAHGAEGTGLGFEMGMVGATVLLHAAGLGLGVGLARFGRASWVRVLGAGAAVGGLVLAVAG